MLEDATLEVAGDGLATDQLLDEVRDIVADLQLPLHAPVDAARVARRGLPAVRRSNDEHGRPARWARSTTAVIDPTGAAWRSAEATFALYLASIRARVGHPAVVAAEGVPVGAARDRDCARNHQRRDRLRHA